MEIKEAIYAYMMRVGMPSRQTVKMHPFNSQMMAMLFLLGVDIFILGMFLIFEAKELKDYTDCIYFIISVVTATVNFVYAGSNLAELFEFIDKLDAIVETRLTNPISQTTYKQASEKIKKLAKYSHFALLRLMPVTTTLPIFFTSFATYFTTDLGVDSFELPFPIMWFPFDVHNPIGYTLAFAIQVTFQIIVNTTVACVLVIVISPCYVLISTAVDIKHEFDILNTSGRARAKGSDVKVTQQFNQFVQFHSESKRLANDFSELVQFVFFSYFSWSIGSICLTMFAITIELRENSSVSLVLQSFTLILFSFGFVFLPCEFGHELRCTFDKIDYEIGQMHWYKFPANLWKLFPTLIANTHEAVHLRVFGSSLCAREDFKRVVNLGCSYFMVLQQFEN